MFQGLELFQSAAALARHAATRQNVVAENVANIDTPGFKARDIDAFARTYANGLSLNVTQAEHIGTNTPGRGRSPHEIETGVQKPNGNTVSIETEMLKSIEAERAHSRALAVYQASLDILKTSIGRGR